MIMKFTTAVLALLSACVASIQAQNDAGRSNNLTSTKRHRVEKIGKLGMPYLGLPEDAEDRRTQTQDHPIDSMKRVLVNSKAPLSSLVLFGIFSLFFQGKNKNEDITVNYHQVLSGFSFFHVFFLMMMIQLIVIAGGINLFDIKHKSRKTSCTCNLHRPRFSFKFKTKNDEQNPSAFNNIDYQQPLSLLALPQRRHRSQVSHRNAFVALLLLTLPHQVLCFHAAESKRVLLAIKVLTGIIALYPFSINLNNFQDRVFLSSSPLVSLDVKFSEEVQSRERDNTFAVIKGITPIESSDIIGGTDNVYSNSKLGHDNNNNSITITELKPKLEPKRNADNATATFTESARNERPHLWIDAVTYAEGIAGWKTSLLELLFFVEKLGGDGSATLVEPCMLSGRLQSCGGCESRGIPVSEIFDLEEYMKPQSTSGGSYPVLVSYDDYQKELHTTTTTASMEKVCMLHNRQNLSIEKRCSSATSWIKDLRQNHIQNVMDKSNKKNFILHLEDYWRGSLYELGWQLGMYMHEEKRFVVGMELPKKHVFERKALPFHPRLEQFVDDLLERANLTSNNFSAIHWRAEKKGMDFIKCAEAINKAKHIMLRKMGLPNSINENESEELNQHHFVLLSSLNEDANKMWLGSKHISSNQTESSQQALQYLLRDNGFIKIDGLLKTYAADDTDTGMLAIYDLIIASKASNFATCARDGKFGCNEATFQLCEACNHIGKFGSMATTLRKESGDNQGRGLSWECWPSE